LVGGARQAETFGLFIRGARGFASSFAKLRLLSSAAFQHSPSFLLPLAAALVSAPLLLFGQRFWRGDVAVEVVFPDRDPT